jgi:uncharacterized membrane protein
MAASRNYRGSVVLQRRKPEDRSTTWHPRKSVLLYFDEVDALLAIMAKTGGDVTAETAEFSGLIAKSDELSAVTAGPLTDCILTTRSADEEMKIVLGQPVGVTISPSDDLPLAGASSQVQAILRRNQRRMGGGNRGEGRLPPLILLGFVVLIIGIVLLVLSFGSTTPTQTTSTGAAVPVAGAKPRSNAHSRPGVEAALAIGAVLVLGPLAFGKNPAPKGTIVLAYRDAAPTWWRRNRTAVGIGLATNFVVAVASFLAGRALGP